MAKPEPDKASGPPLPACIVVFFASAKVPLHGFVYTFVLVLRSVSHIFMHVEVTLTKGARLKSQHPAMFRR